MLNKKIDRCKNNPEKSSTTKMMKIFHQVFTIMSLKNIENKQDVYRGKR